MSLDDTRQISNEDRDMMLRFADGMGDPTFKLWVFIGKRLLHGEETYGGYNFVKYDLKTMAKEEVADLVVYLAAELLKE